MPRFWSVLEYHDPDTGESPSNHIQKILLHGTLEEKNEVVWCRRAQQIIENEEDMVGEYQATVVGGIAIYTMRFSVYTLAYAANLHLKEICYLDFFNGTAESHREDLIERCTKKYGLTK